MKTYILFMDCEGNSDHPSHKDPIVMVSIAEYPSDLGIMAAAGISLIINDKDGNRSAIHLDPDKAIEARKEIQEILEKYYSESEIVENAFDGLKELDVESIGN